jgi:hypothetical protein
MPPSDEVSQSRFGAMLGAAHGVKPLGESPNP